MTTATSTPIQWKAPAEDGEILIWPSPAKLLEQTRGNHRNLASQTQLRLQHVPVSELRATQRQAMGVDADEVVVATGHQIELSHPGVWAKNILINRVVSKLGGGRAYHFAVDTDAPKHLYLRWPGNGKSGSVPITDDPALGKAAWSGLLVGPSPAHLGYMASTLGQAAEHWPFQPMVGVVLEALQTIGQPGKCTRLSGLLANSVHAVDRQLGLNHEVLQVSPLLNGQPYLVLAHHILANALSFAASYNGILRRYRQENGIGSPGRPWPDLRQEADVCEVPFWLDCLKSGQRQRGMVHRRGNQWMLRSPDGQEFALSESGPGLLAGDALCKFIKDNGLRLSPRAMTLMLFFRLLLVDQFVHGIGGGLYDQLTDQLIEQWMGMPAPAFSVSTATLYFPLLGSLDSQPHPLDQLVVEGRRLRHASDDPQKRDLAVRIGQLPRRSLPRQQAFAQMHSDLTRVLHSQEYHQWENRLEDARQQARRNQEVLDRELFFALQPRQRLAGLIQRYQQAL